MATLSDYIQKNLDAIGQPRVTTQTTNSSQNNPNAGLSSLLPLLIFLMNMNKTQTAGITPTPLNPNVATASAILGERPGLANAPLTNPLSSTPTTSNFASQNPSQILAALAKLFG